MAVRRVLIAATLWLSAHAACTVRGSGMTILSKNELDNAPNNGTAAILLHDPKAYDATACASLTETLWNPDTASSATLQQSLAYQSFAGRFPTDQRYWVASTTVGTCRSIDATGTVSTTSCDTKLPLLCTHSAPISLDFVEDKSLPRQMVAPLGNATRVRGYRDAHTFRFFGIKYALQPVRFTHSKVADLPQGEINALEPSKRCPQKGADAASSSEDCLSLNVHTPFLPSPAGTDKNKLRPVAVYIHGGGFLYGNNSQPSADGTNMASRGDIVVVTVNYRLSTLGFLPFPTGTAGGDADGSGNYGMVDLITALQWVQKNIHHFGGDKDQVSILGQSAGALAVQLLLAMPKAQGLFIRANMMTAWQGYPFRGYFDWTRLPTYQEAHLLAGAANIAAGGCDKVPQAEQMECMRKVDAAYLSNLALPYSLPVYDGIYFPTSEPIVNAPGPGSNVTVLTGVTRDEGGKAIDRYPWQNETFLDFAKRALYSYPLAPSYLPSVRPEQFMPDFYERAAINATEAILNATITLISGGEYICTEFAKVYSASASGAYKETYAYMLNRTIMMHQPESLNPDWLFPPATPERPNGDPDLEYFKAHTGEVLPVFGNAARRGRVDRDGKDYTFSRLMSDRWTSFFRTGNPNPDEAWLTARGYTTSLEKVRTEDKWVAANPRQRTHTRWLQWDSHMTDIRDSERCNAIGVKLDHMEDQ